MAGARTHAATCILWRPAPEIEHCVATCISLTHITFCKSCLHACTTCHLHFICSTHADPCIAITSHVAKHVACLPTLLHALLFLALGTIVAGRSQLGPVCFLLLLRGLLERLETQGQAQGQADGALRSRPAHPSLTDDGRHLLCYICFPSKRTISVFMHTLMVSVFASCHAHFVISISRS